MWQAFVTPVLALLDKLIPDPQQREQAKLQLLQAEGNLALQELQASLAPIIAEAQSTDQWTSRARPSFLYVVYVLILASVPMGVLYAAQPETAKAVTEGFHAWLAALPEPLVQLFGMGYLGYTGARSFEKWTGKAKK